MFFPEEIHRRTCVVVAARHFVGRARGRGRQSPTTPPEVSLESERKSRTLSPSNTRCSATSWRGYDSVPKPIPSTFGHHLFAKGSRAGTPPRGRPPDHRSRGDPAVSRAETDILSTYMRGARKQQRGDTFGTPFRRVTTQETPLRDQKCRLFCRKPCTSLVRRPPAKRGGHRDENELESTSVKTPAPRAPRRTTPPRSAASRCRSRLRLSPPRVRS